MAQIEYTPLDNSKEEIRLLHLHFPRENAALIRALEQISALLQNNIRGDESVSTEVITGLLEGVQADLQASIDADKERSNVAAGSIATSPPENQAVDTSDASPVTENQAVGGADGNSLSGNQAVASSDLSPMPQKETVGGASGSSLPENQAIDTSGASPVTERQAVGGSSESSLPEDQAIDASSASPVTETQPIGGSSESSLPANLAVDISGAGPVPEKEAIAGASGSSLPENEAVDASSAVTEKQAVGGSSGSSPPENQARLVEATNSVDSSIPRRFDLQGELKVVSLRDKPEYIALSYVWGDVNRRGTIVLNGVEVGITESLAVALEHLRRNDQPFALWVDAVCINQSDPVEKSEQVMRMTHIYEQASSVLVWLGPSRDRSDWAMDFLVKTGKFLRNSTGPLQSLLGNMNVQEVAKYFEAHPNTLEVLRGLNVGELLDATGAVLRREYWTRGWVLQEVAVAKSVSFRCGNKVSSLDWFEAAMSFWPKLFLSTAYNSVSDPDWTGAWKNGLGSMTKGLSGTAFENMLRERRLYHGNDGTRRTMLGLLTTYNQSGPFDTRLRVTDAKDKIYSLLGLATDADELGIIPDYTKSVEEIYVDVARRILAHGGFDLLTQCRPSAPHRLLPSWVPDWRVGMKGSPSDCSTFDKPYRASGALKAISPRTQPHDPRVLEIMGIKVDAVETTGTLLEEPFFMWGAFNSNIFPLMRDYMKDIEHFCRRSAALEAKVYGEPAHWLEAALWRIPVADQEADMGKGRLGRASDASEERRRSLLAVTEGLLSSVPDHEELPADLLMNAGPLVSAHWHSFELYMSILFRMVGRKPFITERGYVGVCSDDTQPGDVVCIFVGAHTPYVVRPDADEGRYTLVGDAYVHGIMDGEFVEKNKESEMFLLI